MTKEDVRKCHLCDTPTKDKYCTNETCAEYFREENSQEIERTKEIYSILECNLNNDLMAMVYELVNLEIDLEAKCNQ